MQKKTINPIPCKPVSSHPLPISVTAATPCQQPPPGRPLSPPPPPRPPPPGSSHLPTDAPANKNAPQEARGGRPGGRARARGGRGLHNILEGPRLERGESPGRGRGGEASRPGACGTRCTRTTAARRLPFTTLSVVDNLGSIALGSDISSRPGTATRCSSVRLHTPTGQAGQTLERRRRRAAHRSLEVWALSWR